MRNAPASSNGRTSDFGSDNCGSNPQAGTSFPPRCVEDVLAYDRDEVILGFCEYNNEMPTPGDNRSPGYRWGWSNARYDHTREDDGLVGLRVKLAAMFVGKGNDVRH